MRWFRAAAEQGHPLGQYNLGFMFVNGDGTDSDPAEALKWFRLAAKQGESSAQNSLGVMYMDGDGVEQDNCEACAWFIVAANAGNSDAVVSRDALLARLSLWQSFKAGRRAKKLMSEIRGL